MKVYHPLVLVPRHDCRPVHWPGSCLCFHTVYQIVPYEYVLLAIIDTYQINIAGLHIHTGSEIKDVSVFMKVTDVFFDLVPKFPKLQFLD